MKKIRGILGASAIAAALIVGGFAAPAHAGVGGCSSLAKDGRYIVGSCTANNPGPNATMQLGFRCIGERVGAVHYGTVTVGYGASFRYDSECWFGLAEVWRAD